MNREAGRIVVTGLGSLSAAGANMGLLWENARAARSNVRTVHPAGINLPMSVYAVAEIPAAIGKTRRLTRRADRTVLLALRAAQEAWEAAGLEENRVEPGRCGLLVGSSRGPAETNGRVDRRRTKQPSDSAYTTFSSISGVIATALEIRGCSLMTSATCISSAVALKTAMQLIQSGELDVALVGGVDATLLDSLLEQFAATGVLSSETGPNALRPFGRDRSGTVLGEGAAFVVLESEASALRRRATIRGRILHVSQGCDAGFRTGADRNGEGLRRTLESNLRFMKREPGEIDLIHVHGPGTLVNDAMESRCIANVFGPEANQPWSWATKGLTGHTLGASTLFQVVLTLEAIRHSYIPRTANGHDRDPACPIRLTPESGVPLRVRTALCLTSGFWGNTSCVAVGSHEG